MLSHLKMDFVPKKIKLHSDFLSINEFPDEILSNVFQFLDLATRLMAVQTCSRWHRLLSDPRLHLPITISSLSLREHLPSDRFETPGIAPNFNELVHLKTLITHFGHCETLELKAKSDDFIPRVKSILENSMDSADSILKSDSVMIRNFQTDRPSAILAQLPFWTRNLYLHAVQCRPWLSPSFEWPEFLRLECLCLRGFVFQPSTLPESLVVLKYNCMFDRHHLQTFISQLQKCPNLEELEIGSAIFDFTLFSTLIHKVRDSLPKIRCLSFNEVEFPRNVDVMKVACDGAPHWIWKQDRYRTVFAALEEANLGPLNGGEGFYGTVDGFLKTFALKSVFIDAKINDMNDVYGLIPSLTTAGTALRIRLGYPTYATDSNRFRSSTILESPPVELGRVLEEIRLHEIDNAVLMRSIFRCGSFERLVTWEFLRCSALDDEEICFIAKWCPNLEYLSIKSCKRITWFSLTAFLRHWDSNRSKRLIIECIDSAISIDRVAIAMGIDCRMGRYQMGDGKRAEIYRKLLPAGNRGTRLVIWDPATEFEMEREKSSCEKMVIIRDYGRDDLNLNIEFGVVRNLE